MVVGTCALLFLVGLSLALAAEPATTRPNLQTVGLVVMLVAVTTVALVRHDPRP